MAFFKCRTLSQFKIAALNAGSKGVFFSEFRKDSGLWKTDFPAGKFMEIVMAWMLGYYRTATQTWLRVTINEHLDRKEGIDFCIEVKNHGSIFCNIDMKFDKDQDSDWHQSNSSVTVVRTYPSTPGKASSRATMTGVDALREVLSTVLSQEVVDRSLFEKTEVKAILNSVWEKYSSNW